MLAERILTGRLRYLRSRQLQLEPFRAAKLPVSKQQAKYLLYLHVPFCERLCPYCSFNRFQFCSSKAQAYFGQLREEMHMLADLGYDFSSMYIGGGTPTVLVSELCKTIDLARELFSIEDVSSETNPNHLIPEVLEPLAGRVQRLSVGVQSLDDELLKQMQRYETYGSSRQILERIEAVLGVFPVLNIDMIFNFPAQTEAMLRQDIAHLKTLAVNQVTFYPLMVSPVVEKSMLQRFGSIDFGREASYYQLLTSELSDSYTASSAWAFSREQQIMIDEYIVDYDNYVGLGSGSFSYLDGVMYVNTFSLQQYAAAIAKGEMSVDYHMPLAEQEKMRYYFMIKLFGLRLNKRHFAEAFGRPLERALWQEYQFLRLAGAFSRDDGDVLELSATGRYLLLVMMREFFIAVNSVRDLARARLPASERQLTMQSSAQAIPQVLPVSSHG